MTSKLFFLSYKRECVLGFSAPLIKRGGGGVGEDEPVSSWNESDHHLIKYYKCMCGIGRVTITIPGQVSNYMSPDPGVAAHSLPPPPLHTTLLSGCRLIFTKIIWGEGLSNNS